MASLTITFHHDGLFIGLPIEYIEGNSDTIKDVEFDNMTYDKFFDFLAYASKYPVVGLYYCVPGCDLTDGIREIKSNQQLGDFVAVGLEHGGKIDTSHEEVRLNESDMGDKTKWLKGGMDCILLAFWKGKVIDFELPIHAKVKVEIPV
ncbi:hypothetical protein CTI12_AA347800 [Artemisia annua]|uniref:PB1-like domain-containing protein n=1 Tax=Artemisia annua TaxID=35608 RepID=A0A2U1MM32_ARTAN|nr:hypothetical protein CTI12_AA347800 [Artemisia annua]